MPTLFIVVALELLKVFLGLFTLFRCMCFFVCWYVSFCFFFAILLLKSLILALGYGTDCTFHLYDIGQFHVKKKKKRKPFLVRNSSASANQGHSTDFVEKIACAY